MELPPVTNESWDGDTRFRLQLRLTPELRCFDGHFEGAPVLAGVIQLGWVLAFAEQKFQRGWQFSALRSAKFQRLVLPPVTLQLDVEHMPDRQMLRFTYSDTGGIYSSGGVLVEPRQEAVV